MLARLTVKLLKNMLTYVLSADVLLTLVKFAEIFKKLFIYQ